MTLVYLYLCLIPPAILWAIYINALNDKKKWASSVHQILLLLTMICLVFFGLIAIGLLVAELKREEFYWSVALIASLAYAIWNWVREKKY
jgi:undecaprenyl pyrophosphate phosphatase UppP